MGFYSFMFLGGFQLNYSTTFMAMLVWFTLESVAEASRVVLAFMEVDELQDFVAVSRIRFRELKKNHTNAKNHKITLEPSNVYEDLSRNPDIVVMIFILQSIMIAFVVTDIFASETLSCRDGTKGCPIVGTFGSWCFYIVYVMCIFLVCLVCGSFRRSSHTCFAFGCIPSPRSVFFIFWIQQKWHFYANGVFTRSKDQFWTIGTKSRLLDTITTGGQRQYPGTVDGHVSMARSP
jgi:hypothetical protein